MWTVTNNTPFTAERCWVRNKDGAEVWLVAVRGTFLINSDGSLQLADEQDEVCLAPKYRGEPDNSSLLYDSDLHHTKLNTDVIVNGHAYARKDHSATRVDVTLEVANIKKTLCVFGDRVWEQSFAGLSLSQPEPFKKMPLTYERAFGGADEASENTKHHAWEPRNPIGTGFATRKKHLVGKSAPNVEDPKSLIRHWNDRPQPSGYGAIAGHWTPRAQLAGTYDDTWQKERLPLLPEDFDERFYQCTPAGQQSSGFLKGGEGVALSNLTPDGALSFHLPRVSLGFTTHFDDGDERIHRGALHTVVIEPDIPRVLMVWHTNLECHHKVLKLLTTTIDLKTRLHASSKRFAQGAWTR